MHGSQRGSTGSFGRHIALLLSMLLLLAACGSGEDASPDGTGEDVTVDDGATPGAGEETDAADPGGADAAGGGTFVAAVPEDFDAIDPHTASGETGATWLSLIYETLVGVDQNAEPVPGLATEWEISEDGLTYTFSLQEGVQFHNGREMTSEDVVFNLERIRNPDTGAVSQSQLAVISEIQAPDDRTVVLTLEEASASLINDLAQQGRTAIVAPESYDDENTLTEGVGTGPFSFTSYTVNDRLVMSRNDDYWQDPAAIDTVEVRVIPDASARLTALQSGEIDMAWAVPPDQGFAADGQGYRMIEVPQNRANFFGINTQRFDEEVRRAMHLAVSREDIAAAGWEGYAVPTAQPFDEDSFWYVDVDTPTSADIETARSMIEDAGATGTAVTILQWDALGSDTEAQLVASAWNEIGLSATIEIVDIGTLVERAGEGDYDVAYLWIGLITDPSRPYNFFESTSARHGLVGSIGDPEFDALVDQGRETSDPEERRDVYRQILERNYEIAAAYYTVRPEQYLALSDRVENYEQGAYYVSYQRGGLLDASLSD
jgi:peptide/nickel transport system substrate-binding protein